MRDKTLNFDVYICRGNQRKRTPSILRGACLRQVIGEIRPDPRSAGLRYALAALTSGMNLNTPAGPPAQAGRPVRHPVEAADQDSITDWRTYAGPSTLKRHDKRGMVCDSGTASASPPPRAQTRAVNEQTAVVKPLSRRSYGAGSAPGATAARQAMPTNPM